MTLPLFTTSTNGYTLILGLGETGLAAAHWYLRQALPIRLADTRLGSQKVIDELCGQYEVVAVEAVLGSDALASSVLDSVQTVVISPGLALTDEAVAALLIEAEARRIRVISEMELFAQALVDLSNTGYVPKVLAVTGTNGKTTVTQMVKHIAQEAGLKTVAAGNISPAAITALIRALDSNDLPDIWVIELSSFQLVHTFSLPVLASVVLNISQDHIDWHGNMAAYAAAKARLYGMSELAIFNRDDVETKALTNQFESKPVQSFGLSMAPTPRDLGVVEHQGQQWISTSDEYLLPVAALLIMGKHNLSNALAALCLTQAAGIDWQPAVSVLRSYYGEPHRCQFIRSIQGVDFINDSKGTNVGATVAAIEGLSRPLVLIMGGVAKGQDFTPVAAALSQRVCRAVMLIGQDAPLIAAALGTAEVEAQVLTNLEDAVESAFAFALRGDIVLFSPACASFDMFANYIQRGERFVAAVNELALDQGEVV